MAGFAAGLRRLEEHPPEILPLAGPSTRLRRGVWAALLEAVMDDPDFEWLMIDASYIKAHPHSAGAGAEISPSPAKMGVEKQAAHGDRFPRNACKAGGYWGYGSRLLPGFAPDRGHRGRVPAGALSQSKGSDTNEIIAAARKLGMDR